MSVTSLEPVRADNVTATAAALLAVNNIEVISSHIVPEVEELCTWIGVIDRGRMVEVGPKADVLGRVVEVATPEEG